MSAKKILFRLRCKLPGAQGNLVHRIWPIFGNIYASYYENSGRQNIFPTSFWTRLNVLPHLFNLLLKVVHVYSKKKKALLPA